MSFYSNSKSLRSSCARASVAMAAIEPHELGAVDPGFAPRCRARDTGPGYRQLEQPRAEQDAP
eukprot:9467889-Pyramimonas_sp.AAC.1